MFNKWTKPKLCGLGSCIELQQEGDHYILRATEIEDPARHIKVTPVELAVFIASAKAGQYDEVLKTVNNEWKEKFARIGVEV